MARPDTNVTATLGLPLRTTGSVTLGNTVKRGFQLIDAAFASLLAGTGLTAHEVAYTADDSNSTQVASTVGAELDALRARLTEIETLTNDSNSRYINNP